MDLSTVFSDSEDAILFLSTNVFSCFCFSSNDLNSFPETISVGIDLLVSFISCNNSLTLFNTLLSTTLSYLLSK